MSLFDIELSFVIFTKHYRTVSQQFFSVEIKLCKQLITWFYHLVF